MFSQTLNFDCIHVCGKMGQQRNNMSSNMILILSLDVLHLIQSDALITEVYASLCSAVWGETLGENQHAPELTALWYDETHCDQLKQSKVCLMEFNRMKA